jgi:putative transposase
VTAAGVIQHVMNRGNRRAKIFLKPADYQAFVALLVEAARLFRVRLIAFALMPNHWHLVLVADEEGAVSLYMKWLTGTHVRRYHKLYGLGGTGHLYQARYTSVIIQSDRHLLTAIAYVESNPSRARLVLRAEDWPWSSLGAPAAVRELLVTASPVPRPPDWLERVNQPLSNLARFRECIEHGRPFGSLVWAAKTAARHGLGASMRRRGRPRKPSLIAPARIGSRSRPPRLDAITRSARTDPQESDSYPTENGA